MALPSVNSYADFPYASQFAPAITQEEYEEAYDTVRGMWAGVLTMWGACDAAVRDEKRSVALSLLIAWYLADLYPTKIKYGSGGLGMPISEKEIQQVHVKFKNLSLPLEYASLESNQFGVKAALMIHNAPDMMGIYGS